MRTIAMLAGAMVCASAARGAESPDALYGRAYRVLGEAKRAEFKGDAARAAERYAEARTILEGILKEFPGWNAAGVEARVSEAARGAAGSGAGGKTGTDELLLSTRELAAGVGQLEERRLAQYKQLEWMRQKYLNVIEKLAREFARNKHARRVLNLEAGAALTAEQLRAAEKLVAAQTPTPGPKAEEESKDVVSGEPVDTDGDGLSDAEEEKLGTDPRKEDTDGDQLTDYEEVHKYNTDPLDEDTDGDGDLDGEEVNQGYDPLEPKPFEE